MMVWHHLAFKLLPFSDFDSHMCCMFPSATFKGGSNCPEGFGCVAAMGLGLTSSLWICYGLHFCQLLLPTLSKFPVFTTTFAKWLHTGREIFCRAMFTSLSTYLLIGWSNSFILAFEYFDHFLMFYIVCSGMCTFCWYMVLVFILTERLQQLLLVSTCLLLIEMFICKTRCVVVFVLSLHLRNCI